MNRDQIMLSAFLDELEKISQDISMFDRAALAGPAVGGVAGGIYGAMKGKGNPLASALSGAATGATVGWIPGIIRDFRASMRPNQG